MEKNEAIAEYLKIIDEAEALLTGDNLREKHRPVSYNVRNLPGSASILRKNSVMFIAPSMFSAKSVLSEEENLIFEAWWKKSILLPDDGWSLTSVIRERCPFRDGVKASLYRDLLRREIAEFTPKALVLMGADTVSYITGKSDPISSLSLRKISVNRIPTFVTWSPSEYIADRGLRNSVWNSLMFIKKELEKSGSK